MRALIVLLLVLGGCNTEDPTYLIVKVDVRPSVHGVKKLKITLSNAGSTRTDELSLDDKPFPVTFSIAATGRTGDLTIGVDGVDDAGALVGRGAARTIIEPLETTNVLLDPADFVVNTTFAGSQYLSTDFEAVGLQLATLQSGVWTAVYRDDCTACDIYARRFDANGTPVESSLAASDLEFKVSTTPTTSLSFPAIAATGSSSIVVWDYFTATTDGVACRAINDQGAAASSEISLTADTADVVTATALTANSFIITWQTFMTSLVIKGIIVDRNCVVQPGPNNLLPFPISAVGTFAATRAHVAVNPVTTTPSVLYAWIVDNEIHVKSASGNAALGAESVLVARTATEDIDFVRVAPWGNGFAVAARWSTSSGMGPGKIEVYRVTTGGQVMGKILITNNAGSDFASDHAFGIARRSDDALIVVWHWCETGTAGSCDVYGRILRPTGAAVGDEFVINTSTNGDQINPSVIAVGDSFVASWNDGSLLEPDRNGSAVRARVFYPLYDNARGILGATCGSAAPTAPNCDEGLACASGSDGVARCYASCTAAGMVCSNGGACSPGEGGALACTF